MSAQMGYTTVTMQAFSASVAAAWSSLGTGMLSAWLESPCDVTGICLRDADVDLADAQGWLDDWPEGRLFGDLGELRWECLSQSQVHLVCVSDIQIPTDFREPLLLEVQGDEPIILWGSYSTEKQWSEDRIPTLRYPPGWRGPYAVICMRRYEHLADTTRPYDSQIVRYIRYAGNVSLRQLQQEQLCAELL